MVDAKQLKSAHFATFATSASGAGSRRFESCWAHQDRLSQRLGALRRTDGVRTATLARSGHIQRHATSSCKRAEGRRSNQCQPPAKEELALLAQIRLRKPSIVGLAPVATAATSTTRPSSSI